MTNLFVPALGSGFAGPSTGYGGDPYAVQGNSETIF